LCVDNFVTDLENSFLRVQALNSCPAHRRLVIVAASMNRWTRRWRLSVSILLRSARRFLEIGASETRRPHEEKRERHHEPEKDDHPRVPAVTATGGLRWSWKAVGEAFRVGASGLGISQQVKQSVHGRLMAENALAGVVTPASAFFGHVG